MHKYNNGRVCRKPLTGEDGLLDSPDLNDGWTYKDQIDPADSGKTVLEFYASKYTHTSLADWGERLQRGLILLDSQVPAPDAQLRAGQRLSYVRPPWMEPAVPRDIEILFADEELIAVAKPAGLPVLPGGDFLQNTLLRMMEERYGSAAPVHRLGRGTSGLVLFARTGNARRSLSAALRERQLGKTYRALIQGVTMVDDFAIDQPIGPVPYSHLPYIYAADDAGLESVSQCLVVFRDHDSERAIVEVRILTGRPHQIRIHLAAVGHPLVGDPLYGRGGIPTQGAIDNEVLPGDGGYHLHAMRLDLMHPHSGRGMAIICPPPQVLRTDEEMEEVNRVVYQ
jgi:23S rRNA pseudouridine1911/1915/1917 synthase